MRLPETSRSAIGLLRVLLAASLAIPLALFTLASWLNYQTAFGDAQRDLLRLSEVAREHAAKILDGESQVADRVNELVRDLNAASIRRAEKPLHDAFAGIVARLPQVETVLLAGQDGHPLVSAGTYPVPGGWDVSSRDYFRAVMGGQGGAYVTSLQFSDVDRKLFFGLARPWLNSAGELSGVVDVAASPNFFQDFYGVVIAEAGDGPDGRVITLIRDDGQILVRSPPFTGPPPQASATSDFARAVKAHPEQGSYESRSIIDSDAPARIFVYRKVQAYPVYVVAGRSRDVIVAGWRRTMASHLIFGVPATLGLFAITWTALIRSRREEAALSWARQEMTRRETAEAALLRAQRLEAVGQMTGGVAHDFNNLLTIILGSAERLDKRADDPVTVRRVASQIVVAARRGGEVTQQLLAFSRRQFVQPETVDLNKRLSEFRQLLDRAASEAVEVEFDLAPGLDPVRLDPGHFEASILNLVVNARDAMPAGGRVIISTSNLGSPSPDAPGTAAGDLPAEAYVRVAVSDTGCGMDAKTAAKAFEPFFTTKGVGKGTGLGLSQVYGFAKQAGGDVRIVSAVGAGTTVELLLPRSQRRAVERPVVTIPPLRPAAEGEVILVVEDEPSVRQTVVGNLQDLGYATITAASALEALSLLQEATRVDLLFSDVVMPGGMNGLQLSVEARRMRPNLKVILTSGYAGSFDTANPPDVPLLTKPYERAQLAVVLRSVLQS